MDDSRSPNWICKHAEQERTSKLPFGKLLLWVRAKPIAPAKLFRWTSLESNFGLFIYNLFTSRKSPRLSQRLT